LLEQNRIEKMTFQTNTQKRSAIPSRRILWFIALFIGTLISTAIAEQTHWVEIVTTTTVDYDANQTVTRITEYNITSVPPLELSSTLTTVGGTEAHKVDEGTKLTGLTHTTTVTSTQISEEKFAQSTSETLSYPAVILSPTGSPTKADSEAPSAVSTDSPTSSPSVSPTSSPSVSPTSSPSVPISTAVPTVSPSSTPINTTNTTNDEAVTNTTNTANDVAVTNVTNTTSDEAFNNTTNTTNDVAVTNVTNTTSDEAFNNTTNTTNDEGFTPVTPVLNNTNTNTTNNSTNSTADDIFPIFRTSRPTNQPTWLHQHEIVANTDLSIETDLCKMKVHVHYGKGKGGKGGKGGKTEKSKGKGGKGKTKVFDPKKAKKSKKGKGDDGILPILPILPLVDGGVLPLVDGDGILPILPIVAKGKGASKSKKSKSKSKSKKEGKGVLPILPIRGDEGLNETVVADEGLNETVAEGDNLSNDFNDYLGGSTQANSANDEVANNGLSSAPTAVVDDLFNRPSAGKAPKGKTGKSSKTPKASKAPSVSKTKGRRRLHEPRALHYLPIVHGEASHADADTTGTDQPSTWAPTTSTVWDKGKGKGKGYYSGAPSSMPTTVPWACERLGLPMGVRCNEVIEENREKCERLGLPMGARCNEVIEEQREHSIVDGGVQENLEHREENREEILGEAAENKEDREENRGENQQDREEGREENQQDREENRNPEATSSVESTSISHSHGNEPEHVHEVEHAHTDGSSLTTIGSTNGHTHEILVVQHSHDHDVDTDVDTSITPEAVENCDRTLRLDCPEEIPSTPKCDRTIRNDCPEEGPGDVPDCDRRIRDCEKCRFSPYGCRGPRRGQREDASDDYYYVWVTCPAPTHSPHWVAGDEVQAPSVAPYAHSHDLTPHVHTEHTHDGSTHDEQSAHDEHSHEVDLGYSHDHADETGDEALPAITREEACDAFLNEEPLITDHRTVISYRFQMELFNVVDDLEGLMNELDHALEDSVGHDMLDCDKHQDELHEEVNVQLSRTDFVETTPTNTTVVGTRRLRLIARRTTAVGVVQVTTTVSDTPCSQTVTTGPCYLLEGATEVYTDPNARTEDSPSTTQIETSLLTAVKDSVSEISIPEIAQLTFLGGELQSTSFGTGSDGDLSDETFAAASLSKDAPPRESNFTGMGIAILTLICFGVVIIALLVMRRRRNVETMIEEEEDEETVYTKGSRYTTTPLKTKDASNPHSNWNSTPSTVSSDDETRYSAARKVRIVGDADSIYTSEEQISMMNDLNPIEEPHHNHPGRKHSGMDVHQCTSAVCDICNRQGGSRRKHDPTFVPSDDVLVSDAVEVSAFVDRVPLKNARYPDPSERRRNPVDPNRPFVVDDTVTL